MLDCINPSDAMRREYASSTATTYSRLFLVRRPRVERPVQHAIGNRAALATRARRTAD